MASSALKINDIVTHHILSSHPRNRAIVDIKDKESRELQYIKIRHRLFNFYAISLVDPTSFEVRAETQAKNASARLKPIVLHLDNNQDISVDFRDAAVSRFGFEWTFAWEGEKYKWVRENRMGNSLECKAIRKTGDICVAQYLPRILKDEYFGIVSLLRYNMLRCKLTKTHELELVIFMSLLTLLDKSNDASWKRDPINEGIAQFDDTSLKPSLKPEDLYKTDPIPKKDQQKKYKKELMNEMKLLTMFEKEVRRSQKQIQSDQKRQHREAAALSADTSPAQTPTTSPLPTPTSSSLLVRQKSTSALSDDHQTVSPTTSYASTGRLSKLFTLLSNQNSSENRHERSSSNASQHEENSYYYDHQLSLPIIHSDSMRVFTDEFQNMAVQPNNPPSLRSIHWNQPDHQRYQGQQQQQHFIENGRRRVSPSEYNNSFNTNRHRYSSHEDYYYNHHHY